MVLSWFGRWIFRTVALAIGQRLWRTWRARNEAHQPAENAGPPGSERARVDETVLSNNAKEHRS